MKSTIATLLVLTAAASARPKHITTSWSGWKGVKYLIVFGDSYTQTGFTVNGTQPSPSNPLGNPAYPGYTSSNGPNWVDFLTTTYNESLIQTYNLAYGGATVDSALVAPYQSTVLSVKDQVENEFLPTYASKASSAPWTASDSLFAFWIGINDIGNSYWKQNSSLTDAIFAEYSTLVEKVYNSGARNFLFLQVPPVQRSPLTVASGNWSIDTEGAAITDWNKRVQNLADQLKSSHNGTTAFVDSTYSTFTKILDNPKSFPQTSDIKNTTAYCEGYQNGTPTWYTFNETCGVPVNEYFWLNSLHPAFSVHNATAWSIVKNLNSAFRHRFA